MSENVLKKEFKEKDIQRLRNLVQGKYGEKATVGTGYTKQQEFHEEGDVWEEDGRTWTIKNGIKKNITKLDKAKEGIVLPLFCPTCSRTMKPHLDKKWFVMYGHCFDCQVDFEAQLKKEGKLENFKKQVNSDIDGVIHDFNIWIDEEINSSNESWVTEAGDIEKWVGSSKEKMLLNKEETIKYLESLKK